MWQKHKWNIKVIQTNTIAYCVPRFSCISFAMRNCMSLTNRPWKSTGCRVFLLLLFLQSLHQVYFLPTDHSTRNPRQHVVERLDDYIKRIDRLQAKRSEDKVGQADLEHVSSSSLISGNFAVEVQPGSPAAICTIPISALLIYTQATASSL